MHTITIGGGELRLVASPMTPWIYKREFKSDMIGELKVLSDSQDGDAVPPMFGLIQMAWAMAKTADPAMLDFEPWLASLPEDALDFSSIDIGPIMAELKRGFFRGGKKGEAATEEAQGAE